MRLWIPLLLSTVVTVTGLVVYDRLRRGDVRRDPAAPEPDAVPRDETRRAAEGPAEPPVLSGRGDEILLARLDAIERRLRRLEERASGRAPEPAPPARRVPAELRPANASSPESPRREEVEHFRKLRKAAQEADRRTRATLRVEKALQTAELRLTPRQKARVVDAHLAFESRVQEIWAEVKSGASASDTETDWREVIAATNTRLRREFAERVSAFLPWPDAEAVAASLHPPGGK